MPSANFLPELPAVVTKQLRFAGVEYDVGDAFPHRDLGRTPDGKPCPLTVHELRGLWLADLISFEVKAATSRAKPRAPAATE